jgi:hypothetical protein
MSSPPIPHWISGSKLVIPPVVIVEMALDGTSPLFAELSLGEGSSFQICKLGRELGCLHAVAQGSKCIFNKPKLSSDLLKLGSEALVAVIIALVVFDLGDGGPVVKVMCGLVKGMVGGCGASEEVVEPWGHGLGDFFIEVVGGEGLFIVVLANKEANLSIGMEFDPLSVGIVSLANRNLGIDLPIVVLITNGSKGKLKLSISLS